MPERWARAVIRARLPVLAIWVVVVVLGFVAALRLNGLLANVFVVPHTDSDQARLVLEREFHERPEGVFTVVFSARKGERPDVQQRLRAAARLVPTRHA